MAQENIRELALYQVEFSRLDEGLVLSYLVAVAPGQTEVQAIEKAQQLWQEWADENGQPVFFTFDDIQNVEKRRHADAQNTYFRNRCHEAGRCHF